MKKTLPILLFLLYHQLSLAQDNFSTLLPQDRVPSDFTESSSFKYKMDVASISSSDKRYQKKGKKKFYLNSNYNIDDFLRSGKVLFNDPISSYLNEVLYNVLQNDKETLNKLRVYAVKSPVPNAFTTNNGIIFVNIGLLSKLENEAQLAFILSHEVTHYKKQHIINSYIQNIDIKKGKGDFKGFSRDQQQIAKTSYSHELEMEADSEGLKTYLNSSYSKDSLARVFDILQVSDQLLLDQEFEYAFLEHDKYIIPAELQIEEFQIYTTDENYDDKNSTHPNIGKRKANVIKLARHSGEGGKKYIASEEKFQRTVSLSSLEMCRQYLLVHDHLKAFYLAYDLLKGGNNNQTYLQKTIAKAIYGLTYWESENFSGHELIVSKEFQKIKFLFEKMSYSERLILAIQYLQPLSEQLPNDEELNLMLEDCVARLMEVDQDTKDYLFEENEKSDLPYYYHAFEGLKNREGLHNRFIKYIKKEAPVLSKKELRKRKKLQKKAAKHKKGVKVDHTIIADPIYVRIDERKKSSMRFIESEDALKNIQPKVNKAASSLSMDVDFLDMHNLNYNSVETFRNHAIVNEWLGEKFAQNDTSMISPIHNEMIEVSESYGSNHVTWMGNLSVSETKPGKGYYIFYSLVYPPLLPIAIIYALSPNHGTFYFAITFDVRSEQPISNDLRLMKNKDNNSLLTSNIYYTLFKLKNGKL